MVQAVVPLSRIRCVCSSFLDMGAELSDHARTQWLRPRSGISSGIAMHGNFYGVTDPMPAEFNLWQRRRSASTRACHYIPKRIIAFKLRRQWGARGKMQAVRLAHATRQCIELAAPSTVLFYSVRSRMYLRPLLLARRDVLERNVPEVD